MKSENRSCPICNSGSNSIIKHIQLVVPDSFLLPTEYNIVNCSKCGFVFHDVLSLDKYNEYYKRYTGVCEKEYSISKDQEILNSKTLRFIDNIINNNKELFILDIGCSYGVTLTALKELGYVNLYGIDLDEGAISYLRKRGINAEIGNISSNLPQHEGKFDLIIMRHILEHLHDPKAAIANVKKLLKPSGKILIESPNLQLYFQTNDFPGSFIEFEHINHFSLVSLMNLMSDFNLESYEANSEIYPTLRTMFEISKNQGRKICKEVNDKVFIEDSLNIPNKHGEGIISNILNLGDGKIAIWGVSIYVYRLLTHTPLSKCNIKYFVDKNPFTQGQMIMGLSIEDPKVLKKFDGTIVICGKNSTQSIKENIKQLGLKNKIICLNDIN